ncbi:MAG: DNA methyltransferase [Euryarchaeota archaeon]
MAQDRLIKEKDEFVESLHLTPEKIREDLEKMRDVEGFPIGDLEDILELSDPPYYTAYPNPYIKDFIEYYGAPYDEETDDYDVEPFVGDVSEGKNDPIYRAHSYHTKVPPKAIIKFIEHYTNPNDIILDAFCGSGMTGVSAKISNRYSIISDLGPGPSFISSNFNNIFGSDFNFNYKNLISNIKSEIEWVYETNYHNKKYNINHVIWSDILICPHCDNDFVFWDAAVDYKSKKVLKEFICPSCGANLSKKECSRKMDEQGCAIQEPVLINFTFNKKRIEKKPDKEDITLLRKIDDFQIPYWYPSYELPNGYNTAQPKRSHGIQSIDNMYFKRELYVMSKIYSEIINIEDISIRNFLLWAFTSIQEGSSKLNRERPGGLPSKLNGTLYIASTVREINALSFFERKINAMIKLMSNNYSNSKTLVSNQSATKLVNIPNNSIDYIFIDPPFGSNIMYSELNFMWESWLKVFTNNKTEAIINNFQNKGNLEYSDLMIKSFKEFFRVLKPNRWITIEFHNSKAEIWKIIQESIVKGGFIIAQVAVLDKKQGSFKQVTSPGSVKNDLVINAYKPSKSFTECFNKKSGLNLENDFLKIHLKKLPLDPNIERTMQMLYSKYLAQYIQNGFEVRLDSNDFYNLLKENFEERDGYWFTKEQVSQYESFLKLNQISKNDLNQTVLGIYDEKSAIIWLYKFLQEPKSFSEISTEYLQNLMTSQDKMPELKAILDENFITKEGEYRLPSDFEREEMQEVRDKRLSKEFNEILEETKKSKRKIKEVRKEALLHGLMKLYQEKDVEKIKLLGGRLDRKIIDSDDDISAIIDWAQYK